MNTEIDFIMQMRAKGCIHVADIGEGMNLVREQVGDRWCNRYLLNEAEHECYELVDRNFRLCPFGMGDIDHEAPGVRENMERIRQFDASLSFSVFAFNDGVAYVEWVVSAGEGQCPCQLQEERWAARETLGAYIDKHCKVLVPFREMNDMRTRNRYRNKALRILREV